MLQKYILFLVQGVRSKRIFQFFFKLKNIYLLLLYYPLRNKSKIIYVLTPPSQLSNIGDHAQVVAIQQWFKDTSPDLPVVEFNKDETLHLQWIIRKITLPTDLIFIHSGGNLGDTGLWSEKGRRLIIKNFPNNKIISLPQTIHFSNTEVGNWELKKSQEIYNKHKNLTILARDPESEILAKSYFSGLKILACPDFVLYLQDKLKLKETSKKGIVVCLRNDIESALRKEERQMIIGDTKLEVHVIDTTIAKLITRKIRMAELLKILTIIGQSKVLITDRYHGLIFAILTRTPCVVIATYNHKLTSAFEWFNGINFVKLAEKYEEVPLLINQFSVLKNKEDKDWCKEHFSKITNQLF